MNDAEDVSTPREVIEQIRREEYLLDVKASEQVQRGVKSLHKKLDSALKLLSEDLYSKQTHFVLELVQNADDNAYPQDVVPRLSFSLSPERRKLVNIYGTMAYDGC